MSRGEIWDTIWEKLGYRGAEGAEVSVVVSTTLPNEEHRPRRVEFTYPTRLVPAKRLDELTDLVAVGGDAVADSEALYD